MDNARRPRWTGKGEKRGQMIVHVQILAVGIRVCQEAHYLLGPH
jgi:hypothetical protein